MQSKLQASWEDVFQLDYYYSVQKMEKKRMSEITYTSLEVAQSPRCAVSGRGVDRRFLSFGGTSAVTRETCLKV